MLHGPAQTIVGAREQDLTAASIAGFAAKAQAQRRVPEDCRKAQDRADILGLASGWLGF